MTVQGLGATIGGGAIAAALTFVGPMLGGTGAQAAPASSPGLAPFSDCASLRQWYVDHAVDQVGPYGWNDIAYPVTMVKGEAAASSPRAAAQDSVQNGATGTNTQEAGVDEPDVAKTDGRTVVRLEGRRVVLTDVTGTSPRELSAWTLPEGGYQGLLLVGSHVLVQGMAPVAVSSPAGYVPETGSDLYDLDVSDPSAPRLASHTRLSGDVLSLRQYGDTVRVVTSTGLPTLDFVQPGTGIGPAEATERNREVVRASTIQQWLPSTQVDGSAPRTIDCADVYHSTAGTASSATPRALGTAGADQATLGVFTLHPGDPSPVSSVGVTGQGDQVYSSSHRLYVWDTVWGAPFRSPGPGGLVARPLAAPRTEVHAFALDGDATRYVGSGMLSGQVRDSWSFDEHDGFLRVAVTWTRRLPIELPRSVAPGADSGAYSGTDSGTGSSTGSSTGGGSTLSPATDNGIEVLGEQDGRLVTVGEVRGLGRGEQVQSVRWFDDLAVLVTFQQTDPLYTVDVIDPHQPRELGELRLLGFSSYLHPIGGDRLLGLGTAGPDGFGQSDEAKAAVFDIADTSHARQTGETRLGPSTWLSVGSDPHAFTWLPSGAGTGTAITEVQHGSGTTDLVALRVDADGGITATGLPSTGGATDGQQRALPLPGGRVALTGSRVLIWSPRAG